MPRSAGTGNNLLSRYEVSVTVRPTARLVVSVLRDGQGIEEELGPSIADDLNSELESRFSGLVLRPLIGVEPEALHRLRRQAQAVSGEDVASARFRFGGLLSIEGQVEDLRRVVNWIGGEVARFSVRFTVDYWRLEEGDIEWRSETGATPGASTAVAAMWRPLGNDGNGDPTLRWVNVELGWLLPHTEIRHPSLRVLAGGSSRAKCSSWSHGLSTLGLVIGEHTGVAPAVAEPYLISAFSRSSLYGFDVADAILLAGASMDPGDVMLVEQQFPRPLLPIECAQDVWCAIRSVCDAGIIVVEPAGNGGIDLDYLVFKDSGAIVVGAAPLGTGNGCEFVYSNWGGRVDVWGPGSCLLTAAVDCDNPVPVGPITHMSGTFGNTSGAAAVVSGVCVCLQSLRALAGKGRLLPSDMRALLRRSLTESSLQLNSRLFDADAIGQEALKL